MHFDRFPKQSESQNVWRIALNGIECSGGQYVCINHFKSDDYRVYDDGKNILLKRGVVPSIFDVFLIEVNDNEEFDDQISNESDTEADEIEILRSQNADLNQIIKRLKRQHASQKFLMDSNIRRLKKVKSRQLKKIRQLEKHLRPNFVNISGMNVNNLLLF